MHCSLCLLLGSLTQRPWGASCRVSWTWQIPPWAPAHPTSRSSMVPGWKGGKALPFGGSFGEYSLNDLEEQPGEREGGGGHRGHSGALCKERHPAAAARRRRRRKKDAGPVKPPSAQPHPSSASALMSAYSLHPTHSSRPPLCRMELTESRLNSQDQQPEGPNPTPRVSHWYPKFVSSQLGGLWGCPRGGQSSW